jgi:hypothetical protein
LKTPAGPPSFQRAESISSLSYRSNATHGPISVAVVMSMRATAEKFTLPAPVRGRCVSMA